MKWWLNEDWDGPSFTWDVWYACNYRCSYCWWELEDAWARLAKTHKLLPVEKWLKVWGRVRERHGEARLDVIGGEPMRYPNAVELYGRLAELHKVSITTNLSSSASELMKLMDHAGPDRLHVAASWHPQFAKWEDFKAKLTLLKDRGYEPHASVVAWPPFFKEIGAWRDELHRMGVPFTTLVFQGPHEGKQYPDAYDAEQRAFLGMTIPDKGEVEYRLEQRKTKGKLCGAGHVYANVKGGGEVFRCGQDAFGQRPMGNILEEGFGLHDAPKPCPYEHCSCGEFNFLWESWSKAHAR